MEENESSEWYGFIEIMRVIGALGVVVIHVYFSVIGNFPDIRPLAKQAFNTVFMLMNFAVPLFIMISGALFLNSGKTYTYKTIWKNIRRILLCLVLFGLLYSLMQQVFETRSLNGAMLLTGFVDIFTGNLWDHMWYLYMIVGLYLLVPVMKPFFERAGNREAAVALLLLFAFNSFLPWVQETFQLKSGFFLPVKGPYLFYFLAGGLCFRLRGTYGGKMRAWACAAAGLGAAMLVARSFAAEQFTAGDYSAMPICLYTVGVYLLLQEGLLNRTPTGRTVKLAETTWGVYLIHPVFIHLLFKAFRWNPFDFAPLFSVPLVILAVFLLSAGTVSLARKIPMIKEYIL